MDAIEHDEEILVVVSCGFRPERGGEADEEIGVRAACGVGETDAGMTILEPVRLQVPAELKGRKRRAAAGAALYQVMSDLVFRTQDIDKTVLEKIIATASDRGMKQLAVQDPVTGSLSYGKLLTAAALLSQKFMTLFRTSKRRTVKNRAVDSPPNHELQTPTRS